MVEAVLGLLNRVFLIPAEVADPRRLFFRLRSPSTATIASSSSDKSSRDLRLRPPLAERGEGGPLLHVDDLKFGEAGPAMADAEVVAASSKFCFCTCPSLSVRTT